MLVIHILIMPLINFFINVIFDQLITWHLSNSHIQSSDHKSFDYLMGLDIYTWITLDLSSQTQAKDIMQDFEDSGHQAQQKYSSSTLVSHDANCTPQALSNGEEW